MKRIVTCLVLAWTAAVAPAAEGPLRAEAVGEASMPAEVFLSHCRFSPDGRFFLFPTGLREDRERGGWTFTGFSLRDLEGGKESLRVEDVSLGPNLPVFSPDAKKLAWGDSPERGRLVLFLRDLASEKTVRHETVVRKGKAFPAVAALREGAGLVAIADPDPGSWGWDLSVREPGATGERFRVRHFREPYLSIRFEVRFLGDRLIAHTRQPGLAGGGDYRLGVWDVHSGERLLELGAWVAMNTPGFAASADGRRLYRGEGEYDITGVELPSGEVRTLGNVHEELYSHWLELTLSPDGRRLAAWSGSRETVVLFGLPEGTRRDIAVAGGTQVLGFTPSGEALVVKSGRGGVSMLDVESEEPEPVELLPTVTKAALDPSGRYLVTSESTESGKTLRFHRLRRP